MLAPEVVDHSPHGVLGGCSQLGADPIGRVVGTDVGGRGEGTPRQELGRADVHVLADGEADCGAHGRLDGGPAHLAVSLRGVPVAEGEAGAWRSNR